VLSSIAYRGSKVLVSLDALHFVGANSSWSAFSSP